MATHFVTKEADHAVHGHVARGDRTPTFRHTAAIPTGAPSGPTPAVGPNAEDAEVPVVTAPVVVPRKRAVLKTDEVDIRELITVRISLGIRRVYLGFPTASLNAYSIGDRGGGPAMTI